MIQKRKLYKCGICGNIIEVLHGGEGQLICCGESMRHLVENTIDASREKHVPIVEKTDDSIKVTVGSVSHPMETEHYIKWIELIADGKVYRKFLNPGDAPEAVFQVEAAQIMACEYCNLHDLWKA